MCVCGYKYTYVCQSINQCRYVPIYVCLYVIMHVFICLCMSVWMYAFMVFDWMHVCINVCMYGGR